MSRFLRRRPWPALVLALLPACDSPAAAPLRPVSITECETHTAEVCGRWTLRDDAYAANWTQGSLAGIEIVRFDADTAIFRRTDAGGTSPGTTAMYYGRPSGTAIHGGRVVWTDGGITFAGTWKADW